MRKEKVFVRMTLDTLNILKFFAFQNWRSFFFFSDFTFEYFEHKTFRAEEQCPRSANILTYFRKKEKNKKVLREKKKSSRIISKGFLVFNSFMYVKLDMSLSDLAFFLFITCIIPDQWQTLTIIHLIVFKVIKWFAFESFLPFLWGLRRKQTLDLTF